VSGPVPIDALLPASPWPWALGAYLCGSIPFGLLVARAVTGKDVRAVGSGNIGATNVARAAGRKAAFGTLLLDALKGLLPVLFAARFADGGAPGPCAALCAFSAVAGHCFPVWLGFRGGKGVATGLGVALGLSWPAALAGGATWLLLYKLLRISSVGSLAGLVVTLSVAAFLAPRPALFGLCGIAAVILVRHESNLRRLFQRQEK
jgi:acyl phosphate:glycerol-3-phosphate acyltransferase